MTSTSFAHLFHSIRVPHEPKQDQQYLTRQSQYRITSMESIERLVFGIYPFDTKHHRRKRAKLRTTLQTRLTNNGPFLYA